MTRCVDLTVAIPTYNGANRLPEVLERLRSQVGTENFSWEIVVVDNNSTDNTAKVVEEYQDNWPATYPLRYCFEPQQGLSFARQRAIDASEGQLIGFLDDDNLPTPNWVVAAYTFGQAHPTAGAYGSRIYGEFEVSPPANFQRIAPFLALTERGEKPLCYEPHKKVLPPGAGLVVRKSAWLECVPRQLILQTSTVNGQIQRGEDLEAVLHLQNAGWEIWYNPQMCIYHRIPRQRLEKEYLLNLCRGIGLSRYQTRMLSFKAWQRPMALLAYLLNDLRKIILHLMKYRTQVRTDIVAACEMQLMVSSLISPLYLWKRMYFNFKEG